MKKRIIAQTRYLAFSCLFLTIYFPLLGQQLAFPGAEGFGRYASGGRGGEVYHVTNLNDSGEGSFRDAVSKSNRIVVFDVGGVIRIQNRIVIKKNVTVAGQTAPGGGITIYGNGIALNNDSGNNIIRYIRIRMGKNGDSQKDAVGISAGQNYIFDHVSISWGRDGTLDVNGSGIDNLTFQDCIIAQGINNTNHSTGGLMQSGKWSMIRSLYIDNKTRNPKARGTHEFINSVLYNWDQHGYIMGDTQGLSECNLMGNYFIYGPSSNSNSHITGTTSSFHVYPSDNWVDADKDGKLDGSLLTNYKTATVQSRPFSYPGVNKLMSARDALNHVINNVGASKYRDAVDELLINQLKSYGKKGSIINTEDDNGIPGNVGSVPGGAPATDTDRDGMPDQWEKDNGTNPNSADNNGDIDGDGFTNIEEYLDWIINGHITPAYTLTTVVYGQGSISPSSGTYDKGSTVTVTAEPAAGWKFDYWSGDASGTNNPLSFTMDGNKSVAANFIQSGDIQVITIQENQNGFGTYDGTIDNNNAGFTGDGFVNTPNESGQGINWKACMPESSVYSVAWRYANGASADRTARILVDGKVYISNLSFPTTNSWSGWTKTQSTNLTLASGTHEIRLEATNSSGLANIDYITISGNNPGAGECPTAIPATGISITPVYVVTEKGGTFQLSETLAPSNATNQLVDWSSSNPSVANVTSTGLVTAIDEGPATINVTTRDGLYAASCNVTVNNTAEPVIELVPLYELITLVSGRGRVTPSSGLYEAGTKITLSATPATCWQFDGWGGDISGSANPATIIMDGDKSVFAKFSSIEYKLTTSIKGQGSVDPEGGVYPVGAVVSITATPADGWKFVSWEGDVYSTNNPLHLPIDSDKFIIAKFELKEGVEICDYPVNISLPFSKEGTGEFCFVTSDDISEIKSWNLERLLINGTDYTNTWSNSMPPKQNGYFYIVYSGNYLWSHFDATTIKSADETMTTHCFPNPVDNILNVHLNMEPAEEASICLVDATGKVVIKEKMFGPAHAIDMSNLPKGIYLLRVSGSGISHKDFVFKQ